VIDQSPDMKQASNHGFYAYLCRVLLTDLKHVPDELTAWFACLSTENFSLCPLDPLAYAGQSQGVNACMYVFMVRLIWPVIRQVRCRLEQ
jgi:hypothetical protein